MNREQIHRNWARYVQSPAQLLFSRLSKFPPGSGRRLVEVLEIEPGERILEIGGAMGILSGRLLETEIPAEIVNVEVNDSYLGTSIPPEVQTTDSPLDVRGNGFSLPFRDGSFDRILTHTLVNLFESEGWQELHRECRRVLRSSGRVVHMDGVTGGSWYPEELQLPSDERSRRSDLLELLEETHERLNTGFVNTADDLPERFRSTGWQGIEVDFYSASFRLQNSSWDPPQRKLMLELWQKSDRDRIERLGNLLEDSDRMTEQRGNLLRNAIADVQQQALRRRKALENDRELGWRCSTAIVALAVP